ncbi:MAG TPA: sigma-70 family RNA polymerase sigma factor [Clostridium sp.]|jgi:RNA polymerase sigma-70 factor (ECF subfamily)|nr:sigma-70 family RNA polymerase sigma factor [Clostridium sp.]
MKIKYESATGEVIEIETSNYIGDVIIKIEKETYNSNRRETRRHNSIENMEEQGIQFQDKNTDIYKTFNRKETNKNLYNALDKLLPQQKRLIQKVYYRNMSIAQIARDEGVSETAIRNRLNKIYKKLKKFLS